ncbi:Rossmann-like domain-containing protein [Planctomycetota bacterium]
MPNKIIDCLLEEVIPSEVSDFAIFPHSVFVDSMNVGLASTVNASFCGDIAYVGKIHEMTTGELAEMIKSNKIIEAAIGLASINSSLDRSGLNDKLIDINAGQIVQEKGKDKNVSVIGHFPFVERLKRNQNCKNLWVFELAPKADYDLSPDLLPEYIPQSDVVVITGTTIINQSFDDISKLFKDSFNIMLGPSTPLTPTLFDFGIDAICGAIVTNKDKAKQHLSQGAPFRKTKGLEFVMLTREKL